MKTIHEILGSTRKQIDLIQDGKLTKVTTSLPSLDFILNGGIDYYRILTIVGLPGSGKSTLAHQIIDSLQKESDIDVYSFELDMRAEDTMARKLSAMTKIPFSKLYSGNLSKEEIQLLNEAQETLSKRKLFIEQRRKTPTDVIDSIKTFLVNRDTKEPFVFLIDNLTLLKGKDTKASIDEFMAELIELRNDCSDMEIPCLFILLNQMNREIESVDRLTNKRLHYPSKNDIFASSAVYQGSDYVVCIHVPANIPGLGTSYGPQGLSVFDPRHGKKVVYLHVIKQRFGVTSFAACIEDYEHSSIIDYKNL